MGNPTPASASSSVRGRLMVEAYERGGQATVMPWLRNSARSCGCPICRPSRLRCGWEEKLESPARPIGQPDLPTPPASRLRDDSQSEPRSGACLLAGRSPVEALEHVRSFGLRDP